MEEKILINAAFALAWGLDIRQTILYNYIASNSFSWVTETHNGLEFKLLNKDVMLESVESVYQSHQGLQGALLKFQSLNLMRIGKDKDRYAICLNTDLLYQWLLAHSTLCEVTNGKA